MKTWQFVLGFTVVTVGLGLIGQEMGSKAIPKEERWFAGGDLHDRSGREWSEASSDNRLATAADWTMAYIGDDNLARPENLPKLRMLSAEVVDCVDTAVADGGEALQMKASGVAVSCMMIMGYERQK